jgi:hypothetical protein
MNPELKRIKAAQKNHIRQDMLGHQSLLCYNFVSGRAQSIRRNTSGAGVLFVIQNTALQNPIAFDQVGSADQSRYNLFVTDCLPVKISTVRI